MTPIDDSQRMADLKRELAVYKERASQQEKRIADLQAQLETTNTAMRLFRPADPPSLNSHADCSDADQNVEERAAIERIVAAS